MVLKLILINLKLINLINLKINLINLNFSLFLKGNILVPDRIRVYYVVQSLLGCLRLLHWSQALVHFYKHCLCVYVHLPLCHRRLNGHDHQIHSIHCGLLWETRRVLHSVPVYQHQQGNQSHMVCFFLY